MPELASGPVVAAEQPTVRVLADKPASWAQAWRTQTGALATAVAHDARETN